MELSMQKPQYSSNWLSADKQDTDEGFADLYAIIKTTDKLEKAYVDRLISSAEYEIECWKLIAQFKALTSIFKATVPFIDLILDTYKMDWPDSLNRLVTSGVPATAEHLQAFTGAYDASAGTVVSECLQYVTTAMDTLKLNMHAVYQVHPILANLLASLLTILPPDFDGIVKMKNWIARLSRMGAADELTEQQSRQLLFDLESSYNLFMAALLNLGC